MGRVIVKSGTPVTAESLCKTCSNALIRKGFAESEEQTICLANYEVPDLIRFRIAECTHYNNKTQASLYDMKKIAWVLVDGSGKQAGFVSNKQFKKQHGEDALLD